MKARLRIQNNTKRCAKNNFSFHITPTIWVNHRSDETQKAFAQKHNKNLENKHKAMYDFTMFSLNWLTFSIVLTIGKL